MALQPAVHEILSAALPGGIDEVIWLVPQPEVGRPLRCLLIEDVATSMQRKVVHLAAREHRVEDDHLPHRPVRGTCKGLGLLCSWCRAVPSGTEWCRAVVPSGGAERCWRAVLAVCRRCAGGASGASGVATCGMPSPSLPAGKRRGLWCSQSNRGAAGRRWGTRPSLRVGSWSDRRPW